MSTARFDAVDWYDLPRYYDIIFDADTALEADFLQRMLDAHGRCAPPPAGGVRVLEPACGSGRLVLELARRGLRVTGFDLSPEMLAFARARMDAAGLAAQLFEARMEDFRVEGRFELAHCLVSTFKYLLDEDGAAAHLRCVADALVPGGIYALGLHLTQYAWDGMDRERWVGERDGTRVVCNIQSWPPQRRARTERVRSRLAVQEGGRTRRFETNWTFRTYDAAELRGLLARVPALEHVATYDFTYDAASPRELDDEQLDTLLILRRRGRRKPA